MGDHLPRRSPAAPGGASGLVALATAFAAAFAAGAGVAFAVAARGGRRTREGQAEHESGGDAVAPNVIPRSTSSIPRASPDLRDLSRSPLHHLDASRAKLARRAASDGTPNSSDASMKASGSPQLPPPNVFRIVLTGGPCGGKSSLATRIEQALQDMNIDVLTVPEVPTLMLNAGARFNPDGDEKEMLAFEIALTQLQIQMEDSFDRIAASTGRTTVVLLDRGLLDFAAYIKPEMWDAVMQSEPWVSEAFLGVVDRYDLVLNLVSASIGAEAHFRKHESSAAPNAGGATREELDAARQLESKILSAWNGHPHRRIIDNSTDFEGKLARGVAHVKELVVNHRLLS